MRKIPTATYPTPDQIDAHANATDLEAAAMTPGPKQAALIAEVHKLRNYAEMKRLLSVKPAGEQ